MGHIGGGCPKGEARNPKGNSGPTGSGIEDDPLILNKTRKRPINTIHLPGGEYTLTEEQEVFCREYLRTGSVRRAMGIAAPKRSPSLGGYWIRQPHIRDRIFEIQEELRKSTMLDLESHLKELAELRDAAKQAGKYAAAITAEVARGRAAGLYITRTENTHEHRETDLSADQIEARLERLDEHLENLMTKNEARLEDRRKGKAVIDVEADLDD